MISKGQTKRVATWILLAAAGLSVLGCAFVPSGEIVSNGAVAMGADGRPIILNYNPQAVDPTYQQLVDFIHSDATDQEPYIDDVRVCADFAEEVYNNAEAQGIRAGYASLEGANHALNVFNTVDMGLVYVDCTGETLEESTRAPAASASTKTLGAPASWDTIAYVEVGEPVGHISIDSATNYGFAYSAFLSWENDKSALESELAGYNAEIRSKPSFPKAEYDRLQQESRNIDALVKKLGAFWGVDEQAAVTRVTVVWKGR